MTVVGRMEDYDSRWYVRPASLPDIDRFESVTAIIGAANDSSFYLTPWSAKLAAIYAVGKHDSLTTLIGDFGADAAVKLIAGEAKRLREQAAAIGSYQHDVIESLILDRALPMVPEELVDAEVDGERVDLDAITDGFLQFVADYDPDFHLAEATVADPVRRIAGTLDFVADLPAFRKGERLVMADVKTGKNLKSTMRAQLAAYRFCTEVWLDDFGNVAPMVPVDRAVVLHLRREYDRGYKLLEVEAGERELEWFDAMARQFHLGKDLGGKLDQRALYPPLPDGSQPPPLLEDVSLRCRKALIAAGFRSLDELLVPPARLLAVKGVGPKAMEDIVALLEDWQAGRPLSLPVTEAEVA